MNTAHSTLDNIEELIIDAGHIIGLAADSGGGAISLEPGGQFELSGAPLETLHQTCDEVNTHLAQVREVGDDLGGMPQDGLLDIPAFLRRQAN